MNDVDSHPSYLQLDRHCLGVAVDAHVVAHAAGCARCAAYLSSYRPADVLPAWLERAAPVRARAARGPLAAGAALLVAAAALLLCIAPPSPRSYDGAKGAPATLVHVLRAGQAAVWAGEPLAAGDKLRLEVMPEAFEYVSVFSLPPGNQARPILLYSGRVRPRVPTLLPKAWQLDAAPFPEHIAVIFARALVSPSAAELLLHAHDPREVAIVHLNLPKSGSAN